MRPRAQVLDDVRIQIAEYVALRRRVGGELTFQAALTAHREQVRRIYAEDKRDVWRERLSLLDDVCYAEGIA